MAKSLEEGEVKLIIKTFTSILKCLDNLWHMEFESTPAQLNEIKKNIKELEELDVKKTG